VQGVESIVVRLLTHLAGLPSYFLPTPNSYALPESINIDVGGLHPLPEGRGQVVAASFGPKNDERG